MNSQETQRDRAWKPILAVNGFLGISLLFAMFTDFEFRNPYLNLSFPFLVLIVGLVTISKLRVLRKSLKFFLCLPSIILGLPYVFMAFLALINPFSWGLAGELVGTQLAGTYVSPDHFKTVEVYVARRDNYEFESYVATVKLHYNFLPLVARDLCGPDICEVQEGILRTPKDVAQYRFEWIDKDHLSISFENGNSNRHKIIDVDPLKFDVPGPIAILLAILGWNKFL